MNAQPILARIARALARARLEAVLIGNAGAALHGAPVTTLDFDFFFRDTPANRRKLIVLARELGALRVASLEDIVKSKRAANRPKDLAVLPVLESSRRRSMQNASKSGAKSKRNLQLRALRRESERELHDMIVRLLSKPMCERTHFLRRRIAIGSSAL